eukprot:gene6110-6727_t
MHLRAEFLKSHTKLGKEPGKPIVFLVLKILEILNGGPTSEKVMKDTIAVHCSQNGLKATNRGSIAGANIEVSAVCSILHTLGFIEPFVEPGGKKGSKAVEEESNATMEGGEHLSTNASSDEGSGLFEPVSAVLTAKWSKALSALPTKTSDDGKGDPSVSAGAVGVEGLPPPPSLTSQNSTFSQASSLADHPHSALHMYVPSEHMTQEGPDAVDHDMDFMDIFQEHMDLLPALENHHNSHASGGGDVDMTLTPILTSNPSDVSTIYANHSALAVGGSVQGIDCEESRMGMPSVVCVTNSIDGSGSVSQPNTVYQASVPLSTEVPDTNLSSSVLPNGNASKGSSTLAQRRGPSSSRVWRIRPSPGHSPQQLHFLLHAENCLEAWHQACYEAALAEEMEEKAVRQVAALCGVRMPLSPLRVGTSYLKRTFHQNGSGSSSSGSVENGSVKMADGTTLQQEVMTGGAGSGCLHMDGSMYAFDPRSFGSSAGVVCGGLTADMLIEKVKKSKRQRLSASSAATNSSSSCPVALFESSHLSKLSTVCQRTAVDYWSRKHQIDLSAHKGLNGSFGGSDQSSSNNSKKADASKKTGRGHTDPVTLADYFLNIPSTASSSTPTAAGVAASSSSLSATTSFLLGGTYPTPSAKHYCRPLELSGGPGSRVLQGALSMTDLTLTTVEIPWASVAAEFSTISGQEAVLVPEPNGGHSSTVVSALGKAIDNTDSNVALGKNKNVANQPEVLANSSASAFSSGATMQRVGKGKKGLPGKHAGKGDLSREDSNLIGALRRRPSIDVLAPTFKDVISSGLNSKSRSSDNLVAAAIADQKIRDEEVMNVVEEDAQENEGQDEEDITDEAMLARHDRVLRNMRERWATIQQLKLETRKDFVGGTGKKAGGGGNAGENSSLSTSSVRHFRTYGNGGTPGADCPSSLPDELVEKGVNGNGVINRTVSAVGVTIAPKVVKKRGRPPKLPRGVHHAHATTPVQS